VDTVHKLVRALKASLTEAIIQCIKSGGWNESKEMQKVIENIAGPNVRVWVY